jgi:hypothetical protein
MAKPQMQKVQKLTFDLQSYYRRYLPSAYDSSLSIYEQLTNIIEYIRLLTEVTNEMLEKWNEVIEWLLNEGLEEAVLDVMNQWLEDGTFEKLINQKVLGDINDKVDEYKKEVDVQSNYLGRVRSQNITDQYYYWKRVNENIKNADFSLALVTDTHYGWDEKRTRIYNSKKEVIMYNNVINQMVGINDKYHLGDYINGDISPSNIFQSIVEYHDLTKDYIKMLGNHDTGGYYEDLQHRKPKIYGERNGIVHRLSPLEEHLLFMKDNKVTMQDEYTHAFYKDYEDKKIRVIGINTMDIPRTRTTNGELRYPDINAYGISPRQIKWLNDYAFNFKPKGDDSEFWRVLFMVHVPLATELNGGDLHYWDGKAEQIDSTSRVCYPNYYQGTNGKIEKELLYNDGIIRQMIRALDRGETKTLKPYLNSGTVVTEDTGYYFPSENIENNPIQRSRRTMTTAMHYENYINFGSTYSIDGKINDFEITMNNPKPVRVMGILNGHLHKDVVHIDDSNPNRPIYHISLDAYMLDPETEEPNLNNYAMNILMIKNREIFIFRQGHNKGSAENPILVNGATDYASKTFAQYRFKH